MLDQQSRKTSHLRGFVFSNYRNLNNGNLLFESGEILKQKMALNNKEWHVKTYIHQSAMKIIHSQHSLKFSSIKMLCTKNLNFNCLNSVFHYCILTTLFTPFNKGIHTKICPLQFQQHLKITLKASRRFS